MVERAGAGGSGEQHTHNRWQKEQARLATRVPHARRSRPVVDYYKTQKTSRYTRGFLLFYGLLPGLIAGAMDSCSLGKHPADALEAQQAVRSRHE